VGKDYYAIGTVSSGDVCNETVSQAKHVYMFSGIRLSCREYGKPLCYFIILLRIWELALDKSLWRLLVASGVTHWHGACRIMMMMIADM